MMRQIQFTAPQKAELLEVKISEAVLAPDMIRGKTLVSLVSPGTELNSGYFGKNFPQLPGYACVFEVEEIGAEVDGLRPGTRVFSRGGHSEQQCTQARLASPLPEGMDASAAVFARLAGVCMTTLNTAAARPPAKVLITGLGPIGNLAAQIFRHCGYRVTAVDPVESRRNLAESMGIEDVRDSVADAPDLLGKVALHLECSGHEEAVLEGCRLVKRKGEVVLVGVPWRKKTDLLAFDVLHAIFHRYVVLRSGWEHEIPAEPSDYSFYSKKENYEEAIHWISEGILNVKPLAATYSPGNADDAYKALAQQTCPALTVLFDWQKLGD